MQREQAESEEEQRWNSAVQIQHHDGEERGKHDAARQECHQREERQVRCERARRRHVGVAHHVERRAADQHRGEGAARVEQPPCDVPRGKHDHRRQQRVNKVIARENVSAEGKAQRRDQDMKYGRIKMRAADRGVERIVPGGNRALLQNHPGDGDVIVRVWRNGREVVPGQQQHRGHHADAGKTDVVQPLKPEPERAFGPIRFGRFDGGRLEFRALAQDRYQGEGPEAAAQEPQQAEQAEQPRDGGFYGRGDRRSRRECVEPKRNASHETRGDVEPRATPVVTRGTAKKALQRRTQKDGKQEYARNAAEGGVNLGGSSGHALR